MGSLKQLIRNRKLQLTTVAMAISVVSLVGCAGTQASTDTNEASGSGAKTVDFQASGRYKDSVADLPGGINANLDKENAVTNAPQSYVDQNGFTVQPAGTPAI